MKSKKWGASLWAPSSSRRLVLLSVAVAVSLPLVMMAPGSTAWAATGGWTDITDGGTFNHPNGIAVDKAGDVFVVNNTSGTNVVEELPHGSSRWIDITNGFSFNVSYGGKIAVNSQGDLFVTNFEDSQVDELVPVGNSYQSGSWKNITVSGQVYQPYGIAVDSSGDVFVANNERWYWGYPLIEKWNPTTQTWSKVAMTSNTNWPQALAVDSAGDAFLSYAFASGVYKMPQGSKPSDQLTTIPSPFTGGTGSSFDPNGNLYIATGKALWELSPSSSNNYVNGTWKQITSSFLNGPRDVAFDSSGDMFVINTTANAVVEYRVHQPTPTPTAESVTVHGSPYKVIGNFGYNPAAAVQKGTYFGYVEERAALNAGLMFGGEGRNSSYITAILSGDGVGYGDPNVTPVQQGQFAALYQRLAIIPTWSGSNSTTAAQGVAALQATNASNLAIENYLVQIDGYSWAAAKATV